MLFFGSFTRSIVWLNLKLAVSAVCGMFAGGCVWKARAVVGRSLAATSRAPRLLYVAVESAGGG
jgi:hypothetical protein